MEKKTDIMKVCALCEYATPVIDDKHKGLYICSKKGLKNETDHCVRFKYNILSREPRRKKLPEIEVVEI